MLGTPGSTIAVRSTGSTSRIRRIRTVASTTPWRVGTAPPLNPVPAPRGVTGTSKALQARTTVCTSAVVPGKTTASGSDRSIVPSSS